MTTRRAFLGAPLVVAQAARARSAAAVAATPVAATPVAATPVAATPVAIENARVHAGDGSRLDAGTVLLAGREIVAVGPADGVMVPKDARRVDAAGAWVTPGLFDAESATGLFEVAMEASTVELGLDDKYDAIRAAFSVLDGWNVRGVGVPVTRLEGVTTVALTPRGGLVSGRGAVAHLAGRSADAASVRSVVGVYVDLSLAARAAAHGARGGALLRLRELFTDVRQYAKRREDFEKNQMRKVAASRLDLEALVPVVDGALPLVIEVHRAADIQAVLRFAGQQKLKVVLRGCEEGWLVASEIAKERVPVIVSALPNLPRSFEALAARLDNAALLAAAGVKVALSPREDGMPFSRTLRLEAGNAVANGLPWETALAAVTRVPAEIFDVDSELGVLASGKSADVVVWSGDPFEPLSRPRHVFIAGEEIPLVSRQTLLRDRYRKPR